MAATAPKIWKSYAEQIGLLQERGLIIDNEAAAEKTLTDIGYYRLSGYAYSFRKFAADKYSPRLDSFITDSHFADIVALYVFDRDLRQLAAEAIEIIEPAIQTRLAYHLGKFDPLAHEKGAFWDKNALRNSRNGGKSQYMARALSKACEAD